jgi:hypothetical protein
MREMTDTAAGAPSAVAVDADPSADRLRRHLRATIEALFEAELHACLGRHRDGRRSGAAVGYRHGRRERRRAGTFGTTTVSVPRARVEAEAGAVGEWRAQALSRYQRRTRTAQAPIASLDLAGTRTRRVERALCGLFRGAIGKDVVSRAGRKVKVDWQARVAPAASPRRTSSGGSSTAVKPSLNPSSPTPLSEPPDQPQLPTRGAPLENSHQKRHTTGARRASAIAPLPAAVAPTFAPAPMSKTVTESTRGTLNPTPPATAAERRSSSIAIRTTQNGLDASSADIGASTPTLTPAGMRLRPRTADRAVRRDNCR